MGQVRALGSWCGKAYRRWHFEVALGKLCVRSGDVHRDPGVRAGEPITGWTYRGHGKWVGSCAGNRQMDRQGSGQWVDRWIGNYH